MQLSERNAVKIVARLTPWLAPAPSAYFVAWASLVHLDVSLAVAVLIGLVIEFVGLVSVYNWQWLTEWNQTKRKKDPEAPALLPAIMGGFYLIVTVGLVVLLEVVPDLAVYAKAVFPLLALVGTVNLAVIAGQEKREEDQAADRQYQRERRQLSTSKRKPSTRSGNRQPKRKPSTANRKVTTDKRQQLLTLYTDNPEVGATKAGRELGVSRQMVYKYLDALETEGVIERNGQGVKVL